MSRSDIRTDDIRNLNPSAGAADARTDVGRHLPSGEELKRGARQFLNTAEYEFRKVVGASRTAPAPQEPDQAPAQDQANRRKPETPSSEAGQG